MKPSPLQSSSLVHDPDYPRLKEHLIAATGLAYYRGRDEHLCAHLHRRLLALHLADCASYLMVLDGGEAGAVELDTLIADLTVGETFFFRHRELFDALRDVVLPACIQRNRASRRLRIWSAGCSFGAEPYSASIVLKRELAHLVRGWDISILATDINRQFLDSARQGRFDDWALRGLPTQVRDDCFRRCDKAWSIVPELREGVTFQHHNLVTQGFPSAAQNLFAFDVIFCRNVMIYFSKEVNRRLVAQFYDTLAPEGWLLVGPADLNQELFRAYHTVNFADVVLYQKAGTAGPTPESRSLNPTLAADRSTGSSQPARAARTANSPAGRLPGPASCPESPLTAAEANQLGATRHGSAPSPTAASKNARPDVSRQIAELCSLADEGHLEQALRCVCGLLRSNGLDPAIHLYHALILEQLGYHQQTERALRHAVYLDRENVMAHYYLGLTAQRQHRWQPAARSFRNVLELLAPRADDQRIPHADDLTVADLKRLTQLHLAQQPGESPERKNTKRPIGARRDCQVNRRPSREPGAGRSPSSDPITSLASQGFRK